MTPFLLFVHMIAGMILLGLPTAFGPWLRAINLPDVASPVVPSLRKILLISNLHLNASAVILLVSGIWIATTRQLWSVYHWVHAAPILLVLVLLNLNLYWTPVLRKVIANPNVANRRLLRQRLGVFSAIHHTLVTVLTALMIFKPF